jgi:hypothetical protein
MTKYGRFVHFSARKIKETVCAAVPSASQRRRHVARIYSPQGKIALEYPKKDRYVRERQMSRTFRALALTVLVASCGSNYSSAPRDIDNACAILEQRPEYAKAFRAAERRWNVPVHVQMATIYQESKFISDARTPFRYALGVIPMGRQSSAYGYAQALDGTWDDYLAKTGKRRAKRNRMRDATDFMGWYMNETRRRNGVALTDARNQYLAYHEGHSGFARGSHHSKAWLMRVASQVDARADRYEAQLARCRRRL